MSRVGDINRFYSIMYTLSMKTQGMRMLSYCTGKMHWPHRGIYFFYELDEYRINGQLRIVRVGTHALKTGSQTRLWSRLSQHQGFTRGLHVDGGNHRGSVFRKHVGNALIKKHSIPCETWGEGNTASKEIRDAEQPLEKQVSNHIRSMPFLWLQVNDEPGPQSDRGNIERNAIALLSNYCKPQINDPPSMQWLGQYSNNKKISQSGLWNVNHVDESYNTSFLDLLEQYVEEM